MDKEDVADRNVEAKEQYRDILTKPLDRKKSSEQKILDYLPE